MRLSPDDDGAVWHQQQLLDEQLQLEEERENKMSFKARQISNGDFKPIDVGVHRAVSYLMIDLGLQGGGKFEPAYKLALGFQLPDNLSDKGDPLTIVQTYTCSMNKKANLRKLIESWFGKAFPTEEAANEFDLQNLLGRPAFVNVTHTERGGRVYANISTVTGIPASVEKPALKGEAIFYSESMDPPERSKAYAQIPEWLRKKVDEQLRPGTEKAAAPDTDDDVPF
jgi:hypothetical protein